MVDFKQLLDNLAVTTEYLDRINAGKPGTVRDIVRSNYKLLNDAGYNIPLLVSIQHTSSC